MELDGPFGAPKAGPGKHGQAEFDHRGVQAVELIFELELVGRRQWLAANPERTAKSLFVELQQHYPGQFFGNQLRTLQRRV